MNVFSKNVKALLAINKSRSFRTLASRGSGTTKMSKNWGKVVSIAVGAGVLVSATSIILYHYLYGKRYIVVLEKDLNKLSLSLAELRRELEDVRSPKKKYSNVRDRKKSEDRSRGSPTSTNAAAAVTSSAKQPSQPQQHFLSVPTSASSSKSGGWGSSGGTSDGGGSMYSAIETDDPDEEDDEFCDLSSDSSSSYSGKGVPPKIRRISMTTSTTVPVAVGATANYEAIDKLLEGNDEDKTLAYKQLTELHEKNDSDWQVLWRLARASHAMATIEGAKGNQKGKQDYINKGVALASKALELNENHAMVHKWYAICVGARGQFSSTKEKITDGVTYKKHIERAVELDPSDAALYNLLGRFEFEVSSLSYFERKAASLLFGGVPEGTIEGAIAGFKKAEQLKEKPWKENRLLLAKCYIQQGNYAEAVHWLDKALEVPPETSEEKMFDEEIKSLLKKYGSYRVNRA